VSSAELVLGIPLTLPGRLSLDKEVPQQEVARTLESLQSPATRPLTYAQAAASLSAKLCIYPQRWCITSLDPSVHGAPKGPQ
jgi:hypothetical protein